MNTRQVRTIVVDDEPRIRRGIERLVLSCSDEFEIIGSFSSGIELIDFYLKEELEFDLLITDIKMPGMDGLELIKELKNVVSFEAVVISGFNDFKYLQTAIREGAIDYMVKPLIRDEFRQQLQRVNEKIQQKRAEEERLEEIDSELNFVKQSQLLSELFRGFEMDLSKLDWIRDFPQGSYFLLNISKDNQEMYNPEQITKSVEHVITDFLKQNHGMNHWLWKGEGSCYWVLIQHVSNEDNSAYKLAKNLQSQIRSITRQANTIAVSEMFQDLTLLPSLRDNLLSLLQFRLIYGGNQVYSLSSIGKYEMKKVIVKDSKGIETLINKILQSLERFQKEGETHVLLRQFLKELEMLNSPQEIDRNIQLLTVQVVNYLLKYSKTKDEIPLIHEALHLAKSSPNFNTLRGNFIVWMQRIYTSLDQLNKKEQADPVQTSKKWILGNLGENITIEKIAREIPMNPTYFCEYFKNLTGETVLDYVTKTRMEKAKKLLLTTDLKVYDIAQQVGYSDTKYFSKLFKKYFGEVPSKFKEKLKYNSL
ncbi:helix-turn-helix domain-containing protein [Neobacillus sp. 3P2-tot-E-2]|uniref:response regulator transcription factor n=1 Tax=Neobacillus sp. 3P2-tot-E-2 TaxID=3132212 RepID=UPI0039A09AFF